MKFRVSVAALCGVAACALSVPSQAAAEDGARMTAWEASRAREEDDGKIVTGVAKARDRLDSATSTSSLQESEITKISATSLGDLFRNIPGIRAEASSGESNGNYTIRGLPLVSTGAKYLQFQEDGLPVLEFGDILGLAPDFFMRADLNISQIESIRGGSASTFASNAPGGVINLISKTGEVEGGSVMASAGVNYESFRTDFDYGGHLSDTLRFHVGGFYREGSGPRRVGYTAERGGQLKFNITKEFTGGYIRFHAKFLDDHNALFSGGTPVALSGTDSDPEYTNLPGFSVNRDAMLSRNITTLPMIDGDNRLTQMNLHDGNHSVTKAFGFETKFSIGEWSITERMRYADNSADMSFIYPFAIVPAAFAAPAFGAPGGSLAYATGPLAGQAIADPSMLNGNGLLVFSGAINTKVRSANNFTNDLRVSRVWNIAGGDLTSTAGLYTSRQDVRFDRSVVDILQDVNGNGGSALVDIIKADGTRLTQDGVIDFFGPTPGAHSSYDVDYTVVAPYGSLNFHKGKLAVGASLRVDTGKAEGTIRTNSPLDVMTIDVDNNGVITDAERTFTFAPFSRNMPVNYRYDYVSWSASANYRWSDVFSTFARYSRGSRAGADRILFSPAISPVDGSLVEKSAAFDPVKQAEVGLKYRDNGLFANLTGFWAKVDETNTQIRPAANGLTVLQLVRRSYRAIGGEFEGGIRRGPFSLTASATVTDAEITAADDAALVGNKPRHQATLIYQIMPQYDTDLFTVGANVIGTTSSFAQDTNRLKMPAYATVNAFFLLRPIERVELSLNVNNLFNVKAFTDVAAETVPVTGATLGQTLYGRTISTALRFYF